jgi:hypothetical protein
MTQNLTHYISVPSLDAKLLNGLAIVINGLRCFDFMSPVLNSPEMEKLSTIVEEATRSTEEGVKYFVEPAGGSLRRAVSRRHHIIFGRRGSGKSSLLRKAAADLTVERSPIASVDLEPFKGHSYPDLLLSVLIATFKSFKNWLDVAAITPANKISFWTRLFGRAPTKPAYNRKIVERYQINLLII